MVGSYIWKYEGGWECDCAHTLIDCSSAHGGDKKIIVLDKTI